MLDLLKVRINHGNQAIRNLKKAEINPMHRGLPAIENSSCAKNCSECMNICPTHAITGNPLTIDLGKCIFCGDCERICKDRIIKLTNFHKISASKRECLMVNSLVNKDNYLKNAFDINKKIRKIFKRSLKLRQVSAGGCNACEMELNACSNVNFDMGRFGIEIVASPRHADGIIITGPITENMSKALFDTYTAVPDPKLIILAGTCAISGGLFAGSNAINREFLDKHKPDLYVPGCPIHPLTFINGFMNYLGI
jgi:Ni,Fe-hydrogenase III small subunit/NAD-dependent dihydropyrimidine dehydrogenase PreA subunit